MSDEDEQLRNLANGNFVRSPYDVPVANETEVPVEALQTLWDRAKQSKLGRALRGYSGADLAGDVVGAGETGLALDTGALSMPVAGLAGLGGALVDAVHGDDTYPRAQRWQNAVQENLTYHPQTEQGQNNLDAIGQVAELPHRLGDKAYAMGVPPSLLLGLETLADVEGPEALKAIRREAVGAKLAAELRKTVEGGGSMNKARAAARAEVASVPWKEMTAPEAEAAALEGRHLKLDPTTGEVIGGPPGVTTLDEVDAAREHALQRSTEGAHGMDWYDRQSEMLHELAPGREDALAKGIATYSPQADPGTNLSWTAANWNKLLVDPEAKTLTLEGAPKTRQQAQTFLDTVGHGAGSEQIPGGIKVGAFVNDLQKGPGAHPTNDLWTGRGLSQYGDKETRGLAPHEHGYASGETQLLTKELRDEGVKGPLGQDFTEPRQGQAALWTGGRLGNELEGKEYAGKPFDELSPEAQTRALRNSSTGYDTEVPQLTAKMTREVIPARVSGHMSGLVDAPFSEKMMFTRQAEPFHRDIPMHATGTLNLPTGRGLGEFQNALGETEYNPNLTSRMLASFEKGGGPGVEDAAGRILDTLATYHGATDVQAGVPYHMVKTRGVPEGKQNAMSVRYLDPGSHPMAPDTMGIGNVRTIAIRDALKAKGLNLLDTGDGTFTIAGPEYGGSKARDFKQRMSGVDLNVPGLELETKPGNYRGNYIDLEKEWAAPQGQGNVTQRLVDALRAEPQVTERLQNHSNIEATRLRGLNIAEDAAMERGVSGAPRADVRKLRDVLMEKGPKGLVEMTKGWKKADWVKSGLPVVAGMVFADQARRNDGG